MSDSTTTLARRSAGTTTDLAPASFEEKMKYATMLARSGIFAVRTPEAALALMALSEAEGRHPVALLREYDVLPDGRPVLKSTAMLARFQEAGGRVVWRERTDQAVEAEFFGPGSHRGLKIRWTMQDAQRAGLANKTNWRTHPRAMLSARCITEGIKMVAPGVLIGARTPDEGEFDQLDVAIGTPTQAAPAPQPVSVEKPKPTPAETITTGPSDREKRAMDILSKAGFDDESAFNILATAERKKGRKLNDLAAEEFDEWLLGFASMRPKPVATEKRQPAGGRFLPDMPESKGDPVDPDTGEVLFNQAEKPEEAAAAFNH
jgi:hypothetical protein